MMTRKGFNKNLKQDNMEHLVAFLFSKKILVPKSLMLMSTLMIYLQTQITNLEYWEKAANISIALFVLFIGIYVLFREYQKSQKYTKELSERIIDMTEKTAGLAESSTRALENSTHAIKNMTRALDRMINKLDNLDK